MGWKRCGRYGGGENSVCFEVKKSRLQEYKHEVGNDIPRESETPARDGEACENRASVSALGRGREGRGVCLADVGDVW
jgi:hypothetical protein